MNVEEEEEGRENRLAEEQEQEEEDMRPRDRTHGRKMPVRATAAAAAAGGGSAASAARREAVWACACAAAVWLLCTLGLLRLVYADGLPARLLGAEAGGKTLVTVFLMDGVGSDVLAQALAAGDVPHIAALARRGVLVPRGVTGFPSVTGYVFIPLITGQDGADSGVLGLRWFDHTRRAGPFRSYIGAPRCHMVRDLERNISTVYELVGADEHTYSAMNYMARGARVESESQIAYGTAMYRDLVPALALLARVVPFVFSDWVSMSRVIVDEAIRDLRRRPRVQFVVFPAPDGVHHHEGNTTGNYYRALRGVDAAIGRYVAESTRLGQERNRLYVVLGDHGMENVHANINLGRELGTRMGVRATRGGPAVPRSKNLDALYTLDGLRRDRIAVFETVNGNCMSYLYLADPAAHFAKHHLSEHLLTHYKLPSVCSFSSSSFTSPFSSSPSPLTRAHPRVHREKKWMFQRQWPRSRGLSLRCTAGTTTASRWPRGRRRATGRRGAGAAGRCTCAARTGTRRCGRWTARARSCTRSTRTAARTRCSSLRAARAGSACARRRPRGSRARTATRTRTAPCACGGCCGTA